MAVPLGKLFWAQDTSPLLHTSPRGGAILAHRVLGELCWPRQARATTTALIRRFEPSRRGNVLLLHVYLKLNVNWNQEQQNANEGACSQYLN